MIPHRKNVQALLTRRGRKQQNKYIIEGVRIVEDAVASGAVVERIYHTLPEAESRTEALLAAAGAKNIPLWEVDDKELASISDTETPQGVVAVLPNPGWTNDDLWTKRTGDVLILDQVRDPGNVGTLMRTAEAAGARSLIGTRGTVELTNPKVLRASMGAFFRLPTGAVSSIDEICEQAAACQLPVVVASGEGEDAAKVLPALGDVALVLGGEAEGADAAWSDAATAVVRIPQASSVESLNVASAGAILLFRRMWYRD